MAPGGAAATTIAAIARPPRTKGVAGASKIRVNADNWVSRDCGVAGASPVGAIGDCGASADSSGASLGAEEGDWGDGDC